jgi:hypothetical protein
LETVFATQDGKRIRVGLKLTSGGAQALRDQHPASVATHPASEPASAQSGFDVDFTTLASVKRLALEIKKHNPELVGISYTESGNVRLELQE